MGPTPDTPRAVIAAVVGLLAVGLNAVAFVGTGSALWLYLAIALSVLTVINVRALHLGRIAPSERDPFRT